MSEPENFIARWSRRKRAAVHDVAEATPTAAPDAAAEDARAPDAQRGDNDAAPARSSPGETPAAGFDLTKLPPIESITAESDIRAFLAPGVPPELTRAALRRAWAADPWIRNFVGLADYDWDFNTPGAMAGFGSLEMTDELRREVARMVGRSLAGEEGDKPAPTPTAMRAEQTSAETSAESVSTTAATPTQRAQGNRGSSQAEPETSGQAQHNSAPELQCSKTESAAQHSPETSENHQLIVKRPHGSALPK
jgi:Protein of unknown function (DUF3306)